MFRSVPRLLACGLALWAAFAFAADDPSPFSQGRLWRISRSGMPDSFVLGTIHIADARVSRIDPVVLRALEQSRMLALETVPLTLQDADVFENLENGARLEPLLGHAVYTQVREELMSQGLPEPSIARMKPWAAMLKLSRIAARDDASSLDENLFVAARMRRMRVTPLEGIEEQVAAFDTVPMDTQVALLVHAMAHRDALAARVEPTIDAWLRGDLAALARSGDAFPFMRAHYAELEKHIVRGRTAVMHHRLFMDLRAGRVFVAIGAMHLYGDNGLLALLREDGYRVTRVW